jgi:hypothetical protein
MNVSSLKPSQVLVSPGLDPFASIPEDASLCILSLLGIKTLALCGFVSTKWNALAENEKLWQPFARKLAVTHTTGLKEACNTTLIRLIQVTKRIENVIAATIKGFDEDWETLTLNDAAHFQREVYDLVEMKHKGTLLEGLDVHHQLLSLLEGLDVHHQLLSLGLGSINKQEKIAEVLQTYYGGVWGMWAIWSNLAKTKIKHGDREGAINIMHTHLKDCYFERVEVNKSMLTDMCKKKQFNEAIEYFNAHCLEEFNNLNHNKSQRIFYSCLKYEQFDVAQKYIDEIETNKNNYLKFELIKYVLSEKQYDLAKDLIGKYHDSVKDSQDISDVHVWIKILLEAGEISKASNIAHKWQEKAPNFFISILYKRDHYLDTNFCENQ